MKKKDKFRFITGDELVGLAMVRALPCTTRELEIMAKYTAIRWICVQDAPDAHTAWLQHGSQHFQLHNHLNTSGEAVWVCWQCAKALIGILEAEGST